MTLIGSIYNCHVINYGKLSDLKQFCFAPYFVGQELEKNLAGSFALRISWRVVSFESYTCQMQVGGGVLSLPGPWKLKGDADPSSP